MFKDDDTNTIDKEFIEEVVDRHVLNVAFGNTFPLPFIASAERTGAAIFRKELDFSRNRLLDHMSDNKKREILWSCSARFSTEAMRFL
jgi:hypothetical protein